MNPNIEKIIKEEIPSLQTGGYLQSYLGIPKTVMKKQLSVYIVDKNTDSKYNTKSVKQGIMIHWKSIIPILRSINPTKTKLDGVNKSIQDYTSTNNIFYIYDTNSDISKFYNEQREKVSNEQDKQKFSIPDNATTSLTLIQYIKLKTEISIIIIDASSIKNVFNKKFPIKDSMTLETGDRSNRDNIYDTTDIELFFRIKKKNINQGLIKIKPIICGHMEILRNFSEKQLIIMYIILNLMMIRIKLYI